MRVSWIRSDWLDCAARVADSIRLRAADEACGCGGSIDFKHTTTNTNTKVERQEGNNTRRREKRGGEDTARGAARFLNSRCSSWHRPRPEMLPPLEVAWSFRLLRLTCIKRRMHSESDASSVDWELPPPSYPASDETSSREENRSDTPHTREPVTTEAHWRSIDATRTTTGEAEANRRRRQ